MTDDEILAGLTDEERAAMEEDDGSGELPEELSDEEREAEEAGEAEEDAETDDAAAVEAGADDSADDEPDADESPVVAAPIYVAEAPADAEARLAQIAADKAALVEEFDDGELTAKEYQQKLDALGKEERAIERQIDKAEIARDMAEQQAAAERDKQVNEFLSEIGVKRDPEDPQFQVLNKAVILVANLEESANKTAREILQEAYELCVFRKQLTPKASTKADLVPNPQRTKPKAPPTLGRLPAAEMNDTNEGGNRFAHLDRLDPVAREEALSRMSEADVNAYLQYA